MIPLKKSIKSGMHLFRENDRSRELYIIQSGTIKVYRTAGGKEIELAVLEKGSVLGEMALIDGKPRSASAKACEDSEVVIIDSDTFHDKIKGVPSWFMSTIRMTSQKIRQANRRLKSISSEHQGAHVIITLYLYFQRFDRNNQGLEIKATQHHMIQLLGVTYLQVTRVFDFLHQNDFIEIKNETIHAKNLTKLKEYCEYLRFLIRKQFDTMEEPSEKLSTLASVLILKYPKMLNLDGTSTVIDGDLFYHILESNDLHDNYTDFVNQLANNGLCTTSHKSGGSIQRPLGDIVVRLQNTSWKRLYLYDKYNCLKLNF
jgi:CRP-like cAMP-binding protein